MVLQNLSRETWSEGQQDHLSYHWESPGGAVLERDGARTRLPYAVGPGETVALTAALVAPAAAGRYVLRWALVREDAFWYDPPVGGGDAVAVDVGPAPGTWSMEQVEAPRELAAGARATARVRLCNTGANAWADELGDALSYHWLGGEGERLEGVRTSLPARVEPGGCVVLPAELRAGAAGALHPGVAAGPRGRGLVRARRRRGDGRGAGGRPARRVRGAVAEPAAAAGRAAGAGPDRAREPRRRDMAPGTGPEGQLRLDRS
nr:hypothetical protein [Nannocystis pusilla]